MISSLFLLQQPIATWPGKYQWSGNRAQGDCSLEVLEANITYDDGLWQCQVTASQFASQDALASAQARLVVREPPKRIAVVQNKNAIPQGGQITVVDGQVTISHYKIKVIRFLYLRNPSNLQIETLHCESRQSNPPSTMRWFLGDEELKQGVGEARNETEEGDERRWKTVGELRHKFSKADYGKPVTCRVEHPAYATGSRDATVVLDVLCESPSSSDWQLNINVEC